MSGIKIKNMNSPQDLKAIGVLLAKIWNMNKPSSLEFTPPEKGGITLGVYHQETLAGVSYGYPCVKHGPTCFYSKKTAVLPQYRQQGLALALKLKQRELAKEMGYHHIRWTFDPLVASCAWFNVVKLGGFCVQYLEDHYGAQDDVFNRGLPTDRLLFEWPVNTNPTDFHPRRQTPDFSPPPVPLSPTGRPQPVDPIPFPSNKKQYLLPIPRNIHALKETDPDLALTWRLKVRLVFQQMMENGFHVKDFIKGDPGYYVFEVS